VLRCLQDARPVVRRRLVHILGSYPQSSDVISRALLSALADPSPEVRNEALWAVSALQINSADVVKQLTILLNDSTADSTGHHVNALAADGLGKLGQRATKAVLALLSASRSMQLELRCCALGALAQIDKTNRAVLDALIDGVKDRQHSNVRLISAWGLTLLGPKALPAVSSLVELLRDKGHPSDDDLTMARSHAAAALASIGSVGKDAIKSLIDTACSKSDDIMVRVSAIDALGRLITSSPEISALLNQLANDRQDDHRVRAEATEALTRLQ